MLIGAHSYPLQQFKLYFCAMHVFYTTHIEKDKLILPREESTHAVKVLRLQPGSESIILDGKGGKYLANFEGVHQKQCFFTVNKKIDVPRRAVSLTMAVAPTKQIDRFEWFLEKATEIGVERVIPIITHHSERKVVKIERCQKILVAAIKQSQNAWLPEITEPVSLKDFYREYTNPNAARYIAHCHRNDLPLLHLEPKKAEIEMLIGPEGDFSEAEVALAIKNGWKEISLSPNRLRTETAAIVAVHSIALSHT